MIATIILFSYLIRGLFYGFLMIKFGRKNAIYTVSMYISCITSVVYFFVYAFPPTIRINIQGFAELGTTLAVTSTSVYLVKYVSPRRMTRLTPKNTLIGISLIAFVSLIILSYIFPIDLQSNHKIDKLDSTTTVTANKLDVALKEQRSVKKELSKDLEVRKRNTEVITNLPFLMEQHNISLHMKMNELKSQQQKIIIQQDRLLQEIKNKPFRYY